LCTRAEEASHQPSYFPSTAGLVGRKAAQKAGAAQATLSHLNITASVAIINLTAVL